jgi:hypothetical protein
MKSIGFLKAAYIIAWVIYVGYLGRILLRLKKVEAERQELERTNSTARDSVPRT